MSGREEGPVSDSQREGWRSLVAEMTWPRFPGTPAERRAADLVAASFAAAGLEVRREPFRASRVAMARLRRRVQGTFAAGTAAVAALAPGNTGAAALLAIGLLALGAGTGRWRRRLERAFDREPTLASENVVASRPGPGPEGLHLVFLAHVDSKSMRWPTFWPALAALLGLSWLLVAAVAAAAALGGWAFPAALAAPGWILAVALAVFAFDSPGDESPGAMDNASGVAVLRRLAATLPRDPSVASAHLTFLATGAEEIGLAGSMRWIAAREGVLDRARTVFVNVDSVGVGRGLLALDVRGRAPDGRPMRRLVQEAARAAGVRLRVVPFLPGVGVDTMPIGARGFATVSILGEITGAASRRIHSRRDTIEPLREEGLENAFRLALSVAREVAARAAAPAQPA